MHLLYRAFLTCVLVTGGMAGEEAKKRIIPERMAFKLATLADPEAYWPEWRVIRRSVLVFVRPSRTNPDKVQLFNSG